MDIFVIDERGIYPNEPVKEQDQTLLKDSCNLSEVFGKYFLF